MPDPQPAPAMKELFNPARYRLVATEVAAIHPAFDQKKFLTLALRDLDQLSLLQRLRRMTESLHATLPPNLRRASRILRQLAPRLEPGFTTLFLPDYIGVYGLNDPETSLAALKYFTPFGSSEFAIREFLRRDLPGTLAVMETWSRDPDEHVRRLASEGCRPRLPWSFQLPDLIADPSPTLPILENLCADPSLYVRKSVANHLNDITKDHPAWVLDRLATWPLDQPSTAWIARHALRTLIKRGDRRALSVIGAGTRPKLAPPILCLHPPRLTLGDRLHFTLELTSTARQPQRLVIDYAVHYVKKSGHTAAKVFKWKELTLPPGGSVTLTRSQIFRDFSTRTHHPGLHQIDLLINGERLTTTPFHLKTTNNQ